MASLEGKKYLVAGLAPSGRAACTLLRENGAAVTALDPADSPTLRAEAEPLRALGVELIFGQTEPPPGPFDAAVITPGIKLNSPLVQAMKQRGVRVIGELELGFEHAMCLNISVTGTNGKTTTCELVERILSQAGRRTSAAGCYVRPICSLSSQTRELDFLTLEVSAFQLESTEFFRPAIAVLLNITPDHLDWYATMPDYIRAKARLFKNQQAFDWAIVQSEALAQMRSLNLAVPSKIITFSANNRRADITLERGMLISRLPDWTGPLLDLESCLLKGPHNAENIMAALAVGRVLRIPLEQVAEVVRAFKPAPHRCEFVAEVAGVQYINDSKATNLDAVHKALLSLVAPRTNEPNVILIAGGKDKGFEFHDIGPILSQRVKRAILIGESKERIRAAWSLFTPCALADSLEQAVGQAAESAAPGDVVLLSPACSSFDMFKNYYHRGEVFRGTVQQLAKHAGSGAGTLAPNEGSAELAVGSTHAQIESTENE